VTGGLGDERQQHMYRESFGLVADGPDEIARAVRLCCREGVDNIKLNISGDDFVPSARGGHTVMREIEVATAVDAGFAPGEIPLHTGGDLNQMYQSAIINKVPLAAMDYPPAVGRRAFEVLLEILEGRSVPRRIEVGSHVVVSRGHETLSIRADYTVEDWVDWHAPPHAVRGHGLGAAWWRLACSYVGILLVASMIDPVLQEVRMRTVESAHVAVLDRNQVLVLRGAAGYRAMRVQTEVGIRRPFNWNAAGLVLLVNMMSRQLDYFITANARCSPTGRGAYGQYRCTDPRPIGRCPGGALPGSVRGQADTGQRHSHRGRQGRRNPAFGGVWLERFQAVRKRSARSGFLLSRATLPARRLQSG
jgi:hypothetical protein